MFQKNATQYYFIKPNVLMFAVYYQTNIKQRLPMGPCPVTAKSEFKKPNIYNFLYFSRSST